MRAERPTLVTILAARAWSGAVGFTAMAALLHALLGGHEPLRLLETSIAVFGLTLVVGAVLRERGSVSAGAALTAFAMGASAVWGLVLSGGPADALAGLARVIVFAILGLAYLWRAVDGARGLQRWREVRADGALTLGVTALAALVPGPIDRGMLPILALTVAVGGAVAMSLARSAEELTLAGADVEGRPTASAAGGTAFAVGVLAMLVALALPAIEGLVARIAPALGAAVDTLLLAILLPLGYVAAAFVAVVIWLRDLIGPGHSVSLRIPVLPLSNEQLAAQARALEETRPIFAGVALILIFLIALAFALALVIRIAQERAAAVGEGVSVEREAVRGIGLRETLAGLLPQRRIRLRAPADDGTARARILRAYWRLLDLAEQRGPGRRGPSETPAEHERRILESGACWRDASVVVRAFEDLCYGEREPDPSRADDALAALRRVEASG